MPASAAICRHCAACVSRSRLTQPPPWEQASTASDAPAASPVCGWSRSGIGPPGPSASRLRTGPISAGVGVEPGRVSRKSCRASLGDSVLYAGRPDLMTRSITACACGSRAMARLLFAERISEHVVAASALELARALGERRRVEQALVGEELLECGEPPLVVARGLALALGVRDLVDEVGLELAPREAGLVAHRHGHAEDAALPRLVEYQLAVLSRQRRDALHVGDLPARDRLHRRLRPRPAAAGGLTTAPPIIASRVTRAASSGSPRRSGPAGRAGSTRERSAVLESQVRIFGFSGSSTADSRRPTRGSRTVRERYSNDVYQTGGRPISACG